MMKHVEISNNKGLTLRGYLTIPDGAQELVIMFHGYTGNKTEHNGMFRTLSRRLAEIGIASLRMDYANNGESDGEFIDFRFNEAVEDAKLMIDYGATISDIKAISLLGFSMGGAITALVCNYKPVKKLVLISPSGRLGEKLRQSYDAAPKDEEGITASPAFPLSEALVNSFANFYPYEEASKFKNQVLIIHGTKDLAVNYLDGVEYAVKFPNASIHLVNGSGHGYENRNYFLELVEKTIYFFKI